MGWTGVHLLPVLGLNTSMTHNVRKKVYVGDDPSGHPCQVPDWCGNWNAAGPLLREYQIDILHSWTKVYFRTDNKGEIRVPVDVVEDAEPFNQSKMDSLVREGIVKAAIFFLESELAKKKETANATDPV